MPQACDCRVKELHARTSPEVMLGMTPSLEGHLHVGFPLAMVTAVKVFTRRRGNSRSAQECIYQSRASSNQRKEKQTKVQMTRMLLATQSTRHFQPVGDLVY